MNTNPASLFQAWIPLVSVAAVCAAFASPAVQAQNLAQTLAATPSYRVDIIDRLPGNVVATGLQVNESGQVLATGIRTDNGYNQTVSTYWSAPGQWAVPTLAGFNPWRLGDSGSTIGSYGFATIALAPDGSYTTLSTGQFGDYRRVAVVAPNGDHGGTLDFSGQSIYFNQGGVVTTAQLFASARKPGIWAGMNSNGVMAGTTDNGGGLTYNVAWVGRNGVMSALVPTVNGYGGGSYAVDVDSRGRVLGQIGLQNIANKRSVIWGTDNRPTELPFQDRFYARVYGFNADSTVIGQFYSVSGTEAGFWGINTPTGNRSWAELVDSSIGNWRVQSLQDISDSGYIVGTALLTGGESVAFRMTPLSPVPEAGTLVHMALGGAVLMLARRRRWGTRQD